jgi:hypothetical protein
MTERNIDVTDLEVVYDALAEGIDLSGDKQSLYLTKLALILSAELNDRSAVLQAIEDAGRDL